MSGYLVVEVQNRTKCSYKLDEKMREETLGSIKRLVSEEKGIDREMVIEMESFKRESSIRSSNTPPSNESKIKDFEKYLLESEYLGSVCKTLRFSTEFDISEERRKAKFCGVVEANISLEKERMGYEEFVDDSYKERLEKLERENESKTKEIQDLNREIQNIMEILRNYQQNHVAFYSMYQPPNQPQPSMRMYQLYQPPNQPQPSMQPPNQPQPSMRMYQPPNQPQPSMRTSTSGKNIVLIYNLYSVTRGRLVNMLKTHGYNEDCLSSCRIKKSGAGKIVFKEYSDSERFIKNMHGVDLFRNGRKLFVTHGKF